MKSLLFFGLSSEAPKQGKEQVQVEWSEARAGIWDTKCMVPWFKMLLSL